MSSLTLATCEPSTTAAAPLPQRVRSRRRVRGADQPSNPLAAVTAAVRTNEHTEQANTLLPEPSQGSSYFSARKFEYTDDHPADVQLHAWGDDLKEAFEQVALAMFRYETELEHVDLCGRYCIEASGHDALSLLYNFLNECLFLFSGEGIVCRHVHVPSLSRPSSTQPLWRVVGYAYGESFNTRKHAPVGTEVKAITYSHMQIFAKELESAPAAAAKLCEQPPRDASQTVATAAAAAEIFVIVDI